METNIDPESVAADGWVHWSGGDRKATLVERLHGRECAHRAKGNTFDADLLKEARKALQKVGYNA